MWMQSTAFNDVLQVMQFTVYNDIRRTIKAFKHMKARNILMSFLAVFFPWLALLIYDNPGGAVFTLILQATLIGWIPASIWAWRVVHGTNTPPNPNP